jgi:hypothetical protein
MSFLVGRPVDRPSPRNSSVDDGHFRTRTGHDRPDLSCRYSRKISVVGVRNDAHVREVVDWQVLIDREAARQAAAQDCPAGVPVSMREPGDAPGPGLGTGHWRRRIERLSAAVERSAVAVAQLPGGGVRERMDDISRVLRQRLTRWATIAEVGQALWPDDDGTDLDGTAPGAVPVLDGAAREIDDRLRTAYGQLTAIADAIEAIVSADVGYGDADEVTAIVARLLADGSAR